ncbi:hypothetical protein B0H10DRAFT_1959135 [Mycena sp. CBHHK59/15]|nr:hypothetical protein B0H10DRAFT_1959135 [Mycena sp. CBHHK59/15]
MSADDVQLPGWATLETIGEEKIGTRKYKMVTNDKDVRFCGVSFTPITVRYPTCPELRKYRHREVWSGRYIKSSIPIRLIHSSFPGTPSAAKNHKRHQELSIAVGISGAATVGFPEIADVTSTFTLTETFANTLSTHCHRVEIGPAAMIRGKTYHLKAGLLALVHCLQC